MNRKTLLTHVLIWITLIIVSNVIVSLLFGYNIESSVVIASQFSVPTAYFVTVVQLYQLTKKGINVLKDKGHLVKLYLINLVILWVIFFLIDIIF